MRALGPPDASAAAALIRLAFAVQPIPVDPPPSALWETAESVLAQLSAGGGAGAEAEGRLVGTILWVPKEGGLYLARLAVEPAWRGLGIARALVAQAAAEARRQSIARLHLGTRLVLTGNRRLFAACGFREGAQHAHPGYSAPTWIVMEKMLDAQG